MWRPSGYPTPLRKDRALTNLEPNPPQSNNKNDAAPSHHDGDQAKAYLRRELADLAWAMGIQLEILQKYLELGQDPMAFHSIRMIRPSWKALIEIAKRLHELDREGRT